MRELEGREESTKRVAKRGRVPVLRRRQRQENKEPRSIVWPKILLSPFPNCTALKHFLRTIMRVGVRAHTRRQCTY
jgi:hypothetical protein